MKTAVRPRAEMIVLILLVLLVLLALVLLAVLDIIFCTQNKIVELINGLLVAGALGVAAYKLYQRWKDKD